MKGLTADPPLFRIDDGYKLRSPLLPQLAKGDEKQFNLMERQGQTRVHIRDETIVHYGVAYELIHDWGWPAAQIVSEPQAPGISQGSLDLLAFRETDLGSQPFLAVEAKGDKAKLARLVSGMNACDGAPSRGHAPSDHKKCEGLHLLGPTWLWGVASGPTRQLFRVNYSELWVRLEALEDEGPLEFTSGPND